MISRIIPLEIHDQINDLGYLLDALELMTCGIEDEKVQTAFYHMVRTAQLDLARIEDRLEQLDVKRSPRPSSEEIML